MCLAESNIGLRRPDSRNDARPGGIPVRNLDFKRNV